MGLSNAQQTIIIALSDFFAFLGIAGAVIPDFIPPDFRWQFALIFWTFAAVARALKEALGINDNTSPTLSAPIAPVAAPK